MFTVFKDFDLLEVVDTAEKAVSTLKDHPDATHVYEGHTLVNGKIAAIWLAALIRDGLDREEDNLPDFIDNNLTEREIDEEWQEANSWSENPA